VVKKLVALVMHLFVDEDNARKIHLAKVNAFHRITRVNILIFFHAAPLVHLGRQREFEYFEANFRWEVVEARDLLHGRRYGFWGEIDDLAGFWLIVHHLFDGWGYEGLLWLVGERLLLGRPEM
jgi:hypothetical protein